MKKNLLSLSALIVFAFLALASAVNKIHYGAFNYNNKVEDKEGEGNYLVKNDGTKVYGEKIKWQSGMIVKDKIEIDGQQFKIEEIRGYRQGDYYYGRLKNSYIKRIVHGKINVYVQFTEVTNASTNSRGATTYKSYTRTDHYAQKGEDGPLVVFGGQKDIKEIVADCPLAVEMIDMSNSKIRKAIKEDPNYLNSVFEVYNNKCKPLKRSSAK